jgi:hypothetical protein
VVLKREKITNYRNLAASMAMDFFDVEIGKRFSHFGDKYVKKSTTTAHRKDGEESKRALLRGDYRGRLDTPYVPKASWLNKKGGQ